MVSRVQGLRSRRRRVRRRLARVSTGRPRLSVHRTSRHIYAQVIDDARGVTLAAASSLEKEMRGKLRTGSDVEAAKVIGGLIAERALCVGVGEIVFDRGGYIYHGRVKALADAARGGGLRF